MPEEHAAFKAVESYSVLDWQVARVDEVITTGDITTDAPRPHSSWASPFLSHRTRSCSPSEANRGSCNTTGGTFSRSERITTIRQLATWRTGFPAFCSSAAHKSLLQSEAKPCRKPDRPYARYLSVCTLPVAMSMEREPISPLSF